MPLSWITLSPKQREELAQLPGPDGWRRISRSELPSVFPQRMRAKIDTAIVIARPTSTGGAYLVFNALRVDVKPPEIDMEPFGVIVHSSGPGPLGVFSHHGKWQGRTQRPSPVFWEHIARSGIGDYFLTNPPENLREGTLAQLPLGDRLAFEHIVRALRAGEDAPT